MATSRATQFLALRNLTRAAHQIRMTAPSTSPIHRKKRRDLTSHTNSHSTPTSRHISTSASLRTAHDASTIDFAYLPSREDIDPELPTLIRVPILPDNYETPSSSVNPIEEPVNVMRPEISTMSADAVFLPMADLTDGHAMNVDFHEMADRVAMGLRRMGASGGKAPTPEEQASIVKQLWGDIVDDVLGKKKK